VLDSREPPHGDFVAFVEKIEREQLGRAMQPHKLPHLSAGGKGVADESARDETRSLSAAEAQRVLQGLESQGKEVASPRGAMIGVVLGAALIAFGLLAEGGFVLVIVGAVLLWHHLRKLRRAAGPAAHSPRQQVDRAFGEVSGGAARRRNP
jgi:hypothetical protein